MDILWASQILYLKKNDAANSNKESQNFYYF